jgi:hypothetical protein
MQDFEWFIAYHGGDDNQFVQRLKELLCTFSEEEPRLPFGRWQQVDPQFRDLICKMTCMDPSRRITAREALQLSDKQRLPFVRVIERSVLFSAVVMRDSSIHGLQKTRRLGTRRYSCLQALSPCTINTRNGGCAPDTKSRTKMALSSSRDLLRQLHDILVGNHIRRPLEPFPIRQPFLA